MLTSATAPTAAVRVKAPTRRQHNSGIPLDEVRETSTAPTYADRKGAIEKIASTAGKSDQRRLKPPPNIRPRCCASYNNGAAVRWATSRRDSVQDVRRAGMTNAKPRYFVDDPQAAGDIIQTVDGIGQKLPELRAA